MSRFDSWVNLTDCKGVGDNVRSTQPEQVGKKSHPALEMGQSLWWKGKVCSSFLGEAGLKKLPLFEFHTLGQPDN